MRKRTYPPRLQSKIDAQLAKDKVKSDTPSVTPKKAKPKHWAGKIPFDSKAELNCYLSLCKNHPLVIAHGMIALGDNRRIEPDFIIVESVNPDGSFVGRLRDAKAIWKGKRTPHVEPDFAVKCDWLKTRTGITIDIVTEEDFKP
jgi:hypothetical protein